ncbi:MAG: SDR family NAD(P)-dependent oxidoreductase [Planctomycetota bacterium]|jgi:NAD(P)-dependent dehydrogenase (short-subunit alcohol dehydrogenase family)
MGHKRIKDLTGRRVLVTGAGSGIGRATALRFGRAGAHLVLGDKKPEGLAQTREILERAKVTVFTSELDVADRASYEAFAARVHEEVGVIDVLVNNAGVAVHGGLIETPLDDWDWIVGINLSGVMYGCHHFVPRMIERGEGGHVVNIASAAAFFASPELGAYSATKFAVLGFTESLRAELAPKGIGVSAICPGLIRTNIANAMRSRGELADEAARGKVEQVFDKKGRSPDAVADTIVTAVTHNRAQSTVGWEARALYYGRRFIPVLTKGIGARVERWYQRRAKS